MPRLLTAASTVCLLAGTALGTTVRYNIVPASNRNAQTRTIQTGTRIKYYITAEVISDESTADSDGLSLFTIDVLTNLGVAQPEATEFDELIEDNFTLFPSLGTPAGDNIEGIGASQSTFSTTGARTGVGQSGAQDLCSGFLQAPASEGTFSVSIDEDSSANVLNVDFITDGGVHTAQIQIGSGFTIITDDDAEEDPGDEFGPFGPATPEERVLLGSASAGVFGVLTVLGLLIGGPWGAAIGLFFGSLMGLLSLLSGAFTPGTP